MQTAEGQATEQLSHRLVTRANGEIEHHFSYWHRNPLKKLWWHIRWGRDGKRLNRAMQEAARFLPE